MRWIGGPGKVLLVARETCRRRTLELIVHVACGAFEGGMHAGERITGHRQVIELCPEPAIHGVTRIASSWKARMVDGRVAGILGVTGVALGGKPCELADSGALVAFGAIHHGVRPHQWKAVLMILDLAIRDLPSLYRMAVFAIGTELPHMDIGMAVGAMRADVLEHHRSVTFGAAHVLVHAAQWIRGLVMVELRHRPDRLPTRVGVAILARPDGRAVWIGHFGSRSLSSLGDRGRLRFRVRRRRLRSAGRRCAGERPRQQHC